MRLLGQAKLFELLHELPEFAVHACRRGPVSPPRLWSGSGVFGIWSYLRIEVRGLAGVIVVQRVPRVGVIRGRLIGVGERKTRDPFGGEGMAREVDAVERVLGPVLPGCLTWHALRVGGKKGKEGGRGRKRVSHRVSREACHGAWA